ncbi:GNAT family N-acetyltransferase [Erythrobacter sp.]|jgi:RimJ/RimL family protein N-acetyltransferase|uniref:GNAT family N-acetyltransferase n=1 Tax=Erythrobacteraceae TaxID=335929 RepID=UPI001B1C3EB3|nr:GNAT family N-acetyltransferase [Erythrobacter sp.]MBO6527031.1 GNAT family N-acetyltransferase [Erythrobacter sp.]MBO6528912.1 GNAT family N-acetyltransferase [Erythrobacter sp.]
MFHVTERLLLRPAWPEDAEALFGGIADEGVVRNLARAPWPYLPKHAREFVMREQDPRYPVFLITLPSAEGSELIGCIGIDPCEGADAEIGYWIARPYWGRGFASEAASGVLEIARLLGHNRIEAGHFIDNPASGKVLRKIGFLPTGKVAQRHSCARGEDVPCALFRLDLEAADQTSSQAA